MDDALLATMRVEGTIPGFEINLSDTQVATLVKVHANNALLHCACVTCYMYVKDTVHVTGNVFLPSNYVVEAFANLMVCTQDGD